MRLIAAFFLVIFFGDLLSAYRIIPQIVPDVFLLGLLLHMALSFCLLRNLGTL